MDEAFIQSQRDLFIAQLELARKHNLSVIVHNREAKNDLLEILNSHWADWGGYFEGRMVFHCCEPDQDLLDFALAHHVYIGVDGDITYQTEEAGKKREFIRKVPEDLLVLETDSPFLLPEPLRSEKKYPNMPKNISLIGEHVAHCRGVDPISLFSTTTENAKRYIGLMPILRDHFFHETLLIIIVHNTRLNSKLKH